MAMEEAEEPMEEEEEVKDLCLGKFLCDNTVTLSKLGAESPK